MRQKLLIAKEKLTESYKMAEVFTQQWNMQRDIDFAIAAIDRVLSTLDEMKSEGTYAN